MSILRKKNDKIINKKLKFKKFNSKIIKVDTKKIYSFYKNINNKYFLSETNKENLSFIVEISKKLKIKKQVLIQTIQKFKGLNFRQQIIFKKKKINSGTLSNVERYT